jgi:hypothetical protein
VSQVDKKKAELSIYLQSGGRTAVQDVPPERLLPGFPNRLVNEEKENDDKYRNMGLYNVIIAFDPDWTQLSEEQGKLLEKWIGEEGHGLIMVAGPIHTLDLARPNLAQSLKPIRNLLPVHLADARVIENERDTSQPSALSFPKSEKFLKLDADGKGDLAGWSEFFFGKEREDWIKTEDRPLRGFFSAYPVKSVKADAVVLAAFRDPKARMTDGSDLPYLVTLRYGKGRTIYVGSGETWRLRQCSESFSDRLWSQMARYAAGVGGGDKDKPGERTPETTPEQLKMIDVGLRWLAKNQFKDGHWESDGRDDSVKMTALAGMAFVLQGSTIREGEHSTELRKAADWLMQRPNENGLIGLAGGKESARDLEGHGHSMLFLASVYGDEEDKERRKKLEKLLTRAVEYTVKAQAPGGGWGCASRDKAEVVPTVLQLRALLEARNVGIAVPKEALSAGQEYLVKAVDPATPALVPALVATFGPPIKKWLPAAGMFAPDLDGKGSGVSDPEQLYYYADLAQRLGDHGYEKLLPDSKPPERITWTNFRTKAFERFRKTQESDGSWGEGKDKVLATALYLAIMQLDSRVVPGR